MLGTTRFDAGRAVLARVECIEGATGKEKRVELAVGERCSTDEWEELERIDWRGCGWAYDMIAVRVEASAACGESKIGAGHCRRQGQAKNFAFARLSFLHP